VCHAKVAGSAPSMVGKVSSASPILKSGYILAMLSKCKGRYIKLSNTNKKVANYFLESCESMLSTFIFSLVHLPSFFLSQAAVYL
jgi:hypothetical protein